MPSRSRNPLQAGFTLIEVVLAISLLSFIVIFYGSTIRTTVAAKEKVRVAVRQFETMQGLLERLHRDLEGAYLEATSATSEGSVTVFELENDSDGGAPLDLLLFTTFSNNVLFKEGGDHNAFAHSEIMYDFIKDEDEEKGTYTMLRRQDPLPDYEVDAGGAIFPLVSGLRGFDVQAYDAEDTSWHENWNSRDRENRLPAALQFTVWYGGLRDEPDTWRPLSRIVPLAMHERQ